MEVHNANIYHCVSCGRVMHVKLEAEPPQCCGHTMTKAFAETVREGDVAGDIHHGESDTALSTNEDRKKPR